MQINQNINCMKRVTYLNFILTFIILSACNSNPQKEIIGLWEQHFVGKTDVRDVDTLEIRFENDSHHIELFNKQEGYEPVFSNILFDGKELTFKKDVNEKTNYYKYVLSDDKKWLIGTVETWKGTKRDIKLKRIK